MPLWAVLFTAFALALSLAAIGCGVFAILAKRPAISRTRIAELEASCAELLDSVDSMGKSLTKLNSRRRARESVERRKDASALPDPNVDPAGWKKAMRARIAAGDVGHVDDGQKIEH